MAISVTFDHFGSVSVSYFSNSTFSQGFRNELKTQSCMHRIIFSFNIEICRNSYYQSSRIKAMHYYRANEHSVANCVFGLFKKFGLWPPLARLHYGQPDYWQLTSLTIAKWSRIEKRSSGCVCVIVGSRSSQNQKRKIRADKTEEVKTVCNCLMDDG